MSRITKTHINTAVFHLNRATEHTSGASYRVERSLSNGYLLQRIDAGYETVYGTTNAREMLAYLEGMIQGYRHSRQIYRVPRYEYVDGVPDRNHRNGDYSYDFLPDALKAAGLMAWQSGESCYVVYGKNALTAAEVTPDGKCFINRDGKMRLEYQYTADTHWVARVNEGKLATRRI